MFRRTAPSTDPPPKERAENTHRTPHHASEKAIIDPVTSAHSAALAKRYCPSNRLGITPDQVHAEALTRIWQRSRTVDTAELDGYVRSRLAYAYKTLVRRSTTSASREVSVEPHVLAQSIDRCAGAVAPTDPADEVDEAEWIRALQEEVTRRVAQLGQRDLVRARALSTLLVLLAIAANGGCLPASVPERSSRLEEGEVDLLAATWLADPSLRATDDGPDDAALRQRRRRLIAVVRREFATLMASTDEPEVAA